MTHCDRRSAEGSDRVTIRLAVPDDAGPMCDIYNTEVTGSTATFDLVARTVEEQREWLARRSGAFCAIVAVDTGTGRVIGFAALSPYKDRPAYNTTVENSVYVHRDFTGAGVGSALMRRLVEVARHSGFHSIIARVEASGAASRALHRSAGFELVGVEHEVGRKFGRWLSVAVMQKML